MGDMTISNARAAQRTAPNPIRDRDALMSALDSALRDATDIGRPVAVLVFKMHGPSHAAPSGAPLDSDELAAIVGARLSRIFRDGDCVSRLDHGLFGCLVGGMADQQALNRLACRAQDAIAQTVWIDGQSLQPVLSIGVAVWPQDGNTRDAVLASAQAAMAYARRHQTGSVFSHVEPASLATSRSTRSVTSEPTPRKPA